MKETATTPKAQTLAEARHEADVLHRSGGVALLSLAAFWGIAAALFQWGTPVAGQVALFLGTIAAHPVAWMVLKLVGGPVMLPRTNPLNGLFYQILCIQIAGVVAGIMAANARPSVFFATAMLGLGAAFLPSASLYGKNFYLLIGAVFVLLPAICAFVAKPLLPWFGLIGVVLLILAGGLFLRLDGGNGLPLPRTFMGERVGDGDQGRPSDPTDAEQKGSHGGAASGASAGSESNSNELSASSSQPTNTFDDFDADNDDPYGLRDGSYDVTDDAPEQSENKEK